MVCRLILCKEMCTRILGSKTFVCITGADSSYTVPTARNEERDQREVGSTHGQVAHTSRVELHMSTAGNPSLPRPQFFLHSPFLLSPRFLCRSPPTKARVRRHVRSCGWQVAEGADGSATRSLRSGGSPSTLAAPESGRERRPRFAMFCPRATSALATPPRGETPTSPMPYRRVTCERMRRHGRREHGVQRAVGSR